MVIRSAYFDLHKNVPIAGNENASTRATENDESYSSGVVPTLFSIWVT